MGRDPIILGALGKSLIDTVIKRQMNEIERCYQQSVAQDPSLSGTIAVKFVIAQDGSVAQATIKSSTMGSAAVENCVVSAFEPIQFPNPRGGGIVIATYAFTFSSR